MEALKNNLARRTFTAAFVFSFNVALTAYINSTLLSGYFSAQVVGIIFSLSSLSTLLVLEFSPKILEKYGVRNTTTAFLMINLLMIAVLSSSSSGILLALALIFYVSSNNIVLYNLDIIIEHFAKQNSIGEIRGLYLTVTNLAWLASPFLAGILVEKLGISFLYSFVSLATVPALLTIYFGLRNYTDAKYIDRSLIGSWSYVHSHKSISTVIFLNFLLQLFYAWMVIYTPLYLTEVKGFEFSELGIIFTIMLLPFVLLQLPLGKLADRKLGEKELLAAGFAVMSCAVLLFGIYKGESLLFIALILFLSRVGAATSEVMSETYFFKYIDDREPFLISIFRVMSPVAYLIGPVLATFILGVSGFTALYTVLGLFMIIGIIFALKLHDTK